MLEYLGHPDRRRRPQSEHHWFAVQMQHRIPSTTRYRAWRRRRLLLQDSVFVGKRELESLDLLHELPKLGIPQFCRTISRTSEAFMLLEHFMDVATDVDVQTVAIAHDNADTKYLLSR